MGTHPRRLVLVALGAGLVAALAACGGDDGSGGPDATTCTPVDDGNPCTADVCTGGAPAHEPVTPGTPCPTGSCNAAGTCAAPSCTDGFHNGTETGVDCGGSCAPASQCPAGQGCRLGSDCASGACIAMVCQPARCGDGLVQAGEMCDDGNDTNGDGCDDGPGDACRPTGCGNGVITGAEVCDDGNAINGDGCDDNCTPTGCGNGVRTATEACDDGNTASADGCSMACALEAGFTCTVAVPDVCATTCGDGIRAGTEGCDDGDATGGDGCDALCRVELGYTCTMATPSVCTSTCGDGIVANNEGCDDAPPAENGDGCSATCMVEAGFLCTGTQPSVCARACGNGQVDAGEQCDDGNQVAGDGCGATCQFDLGCVAGQVQGVASATPALPIPDNDPTGITSAVAIAGNGAVTRAAVFIGGITHTFDGDLDLALIGPSGVSRELSTRRGSGGDGFRQTFFTDLATDPIALGVAPFTGRFKPDQSLSTTAATDFLGGTAHGTWTLRIFDGAAQDVGSLDAWSLVVCMDPTAPFCGDGIRNGAEECDDGNLVNTDACSNRCQVTTGCGNGALDAGEQCDDDNLVAGDGCSPTCVVDITCPAGQTPVVVSNANPVDIPDNDPTGVASPVAIVAAGAVTKLVPVITTLTHTSDADLDMFLIGPNGVARELSTDNGGTGDNYSGTQLDDTATNLVSLGAAPFTGRFRPEQTLATVTGTDFSHASAAGTWTLKVSDDATGEVGTLGRWTLTACVDPAAPYCGDHIVNGTEQCDDGNLIDSDSCSNLCRTNGCGDGILAPGEACDDGNLAAGDGCSPTCTADIGCGPGELAVVINHAGSAAIPDTVGGLVSAVAIPTAGLVRRVIPIVNVTDATDDQLDLFLESPRGVQRDLSSDQAGVNYRGTLFSDSAATAIVLGMAPFSGAFKPEQTISDPTGFAGQQAQGNWILRASDDTVGGTGTLDSWSLAVCIDEAAGARVCGNGVVETGETCDDGGVVAGDGCSAACQLELGCAGGQTAVILSASDLPQLIPDDDPAGAASVITVAGAGTVAKAMVVVGTVTHTFDGDLDLSLISPAGTTIDLSSGNGAGGDDFVSTIFADGAASSITTAVAPMRGRFSPEAPLAGVDTQAAAGAWTLEVVDHATADTGVVVSWTLGLCVQ